MAGYKRTLRRKSHKLGKNEHEVTTTPGIVCLPDETILAICNYIQEDHKAPIDSLCNLSLVCRRLHYLVLPLCFPQGDHFTRMIVVDNIGHLRPLRLALFLKSTGVLIIRIKAESYVGMLQGLTRLVQNMSSISSLNIQLPLNVPSPEEMFSLIGLLLNELSKISCASLRFSHLQWTAPTLFCKWLEKPKKLPVVKKSFKRSGLQLLRRKGSSPLVQLNRLHIHSPVVLMSPMLTRTIAIINTSPITSFELDCKDFSAEFLSGFFPLLHLPALCDFAIWNSSLQFEDFFKFCQRHKTIETFQSLSETSPFDRGTLQFSLPKLNDLCISGETAFCLLRPRNPVLLPSLTSLRIGRIASYATFLDILQVTQSYPTITRLTLTINCQWEAQCKTWLGHFLRSRTQKNITDLRLNIEYAPNMNAGELLSQWISCCFPNLRSVDLPCHSILPMRSKIVLAKSLLKHIWIPKIGVGYETHKASCWLSQDLSHSDWICKQTGKRYK